MPSPLSSEPDQRRATIAIVWMVVTFAYLSFCAGTFTGLYRQVAEFQLRHFGSYPETGSFIVPLFLLWLPVRWIAPKFWRRPLGDRPQTSPTVRPTTATQSGTNTLVAGRTGVASRRWRPWKVGLAAAGALILAVAGWVGISVALSWKELTGPYHADVRLIDLAKNEPFRPDAYLVKVIGEAQPDYMLVFATTFQGSETRKAYIPLTAPGWTPKQPIRVIRREQLNEHQPLPFGAGVERQVRTDTLRIDQDGVPGMVRASLEEKGATLAPDAIVIYDRFD